MKTILCLLLTAFSLQAQFDYTDIPFLAQAAQPTSTGFNPLSLSNMVFWFRAQDYSASPDGTFLTNILDKSTSGNHATNPASRFAPVLTNNQINGRSAFMFTWQSNRLMQISNASPFSTAKSGEIFAVLRSESSPLLTGNRANGGALWQMENIQTDPNPNLRWDGSYHPNQSNTLVESFGARIPSIAPLPWSQQVSNWHIYSVSTSPSNVQVYYNGDLISGNDLTTTGFTNSIRIGSCNVPGIGLGYWSGLIADVLAFSNVLSSIDRSNLTVYFSSLYSIPTSNTMAVYSPTSFAKLNGWWKADSLSGLIPDGGVVSNWLNQAGTGTNWTNVTAASRPIWHSNVYAGNPCITFDSSINHHLYINPDGMISNNALESLSIISVTKATNSQNALLIRSANTPHWTLRWSPGGTFNVNDFCSPNVDHLCAPIGRSGSNLTTDAFMLETLPGQMNFFQGMTNATTLGQTNLALSRWNMVGGTGFAPFGGDVCEFMYYTTNLTFDAYVKLYYTYLRPRWGLP